MTELQQNCFLSLTGCLVPPPSGPFAASTLKAQQGPKGEVHSVNQCGGLMTAQENHIVSTCPDRNRSLCVEGGVKAERTARRIGQMYRYVPTNGDSEGNAIAWGLQHMLAVLFSDRNVHRRRPALRQVEMPGRPWCPAEERFKAW